MVYYICCYGIITLAMITWSILKKYNIFYDKKGHLSFKIFKYFLNYLIVWRIFSKK